MQKPRPPKTDPALVTGRLNVNDFVAARKDDIRVLERLVASAGSKSKKRAFQSLPRTERRRAASHDAKRVPRKHGLRKRAELENLHANVKKLKSHTRPRPPPKAPDIRDCATFNEKAKIPPDGFGVRFSDRQRDKIWLPTHIWHKKRAFVEKLGNHMVPVTATQKQYRRTHRLLANIDEPGVMAWDTSFYATIVVQCDAAFRDFDSILEPVLPGVTAPIYKNGFKHWQGIFNQSGPVIVHWLLPSKFAILCHPFLFDEVWNVFASAQASSAPLTLQDARHAVGSIDLLGSNALAVLADTLVPVPDSCNDAVKVHWDSLASVRSTDVLPSRSVIDFVACDPRLFGKRFKRHNTAAELPISFDFAAMQQVRGGVYEPECRQKSLNGLVKQSQIDMRKKDPVIFSSENDARIPVSVLVLDDGRIRILLPRSWVLPTWLTIFTRKHAMIGGQKELHQLAFERQCPFYPFDFPQMAQASYPFVNPPSTHSHRKSEISRPSEVAKLQPVLAKMSLKIARLEVTSRGTPEPGSLIYSIPESKVPYWLRASATTKLPCDYKKEETFLGVVTSGGFNLLKAKGTGVGLLGEPGPQCSKKYCLVGGKAQNLLTLAQYEFLPANDVSAIL